MVDSNTLKNTNIMKSRASFKGHPLHPMLIAFPVAFFTGTLLFDILGFINNNPNFWQTGMYMEILGILGGLVAAIPGAIDYFTTVPPKSSAKKRATKHAFTNISMLIVFSVALFYRQEHGAIQIVILGFEIVGFALISFAGWMGATLVYRNQIGVNPRYANAGKWNEAYFDKKTGEIEVAKTTELKTDQMKLLHLKNKRIVLARTEQEFVAFDDHCSHRGGSLAGGAMICGTVQCPWHGSQFDVKTGEVKAGPAKVKIKTYTVKEANGKVYLTL
jgi:uncharacterized membrane protein/nitrite reductase/ring-hydroxylating ferredoxin subunit